MEKKNSKLKSLALFVIVISSVLVSALAFSVLTSRGEFTYNLKTFSSYDELGSYLHKIVSGYQGSGRSVFEMLASPSSSAIKTTSVDSSNGGGESLDFSKTNIQVEGVDEPDIVKTDGTYLYIVVDQTVFIVLAYPAEDARILSKITLDNNTYPSNIFINDDRLVIFASSSREIEPTENNEIYKNYYWNTISTTVIKIYDVSDRSNPEVARDVEIDGWYVDSRMIGDYIYVVASEDTYTIYPLLEDGNYTINIPEIKIDGDVQEIPPSSIHYVDIPDPPESMTHVISIDVKDDSEDVMQKSFMLGGTQTMYVSENNIYLVYTRYQYIPLLLTGGVGSYSDQEKTLIHRVSIDAGEVSYDAQGEIQGHVLNQFSMDEHDGYFRIATTTGNVWDGTAKNNLYVLDMDLKEVGKIENIAPGETIYSARFMGDRAYMVTFVKVDPFFTIDLSDPYNPTIMGELKIPGFSDYLHPYDVDHIIGVGKNAVAASEEETEQRDLTFAWYQGLKISLFNVSDFENPTEVYSIGIGDRGTDSPALYDHKAFLFDKQKELLVIPVSLYEISEETKELYEQDPGSVYGEFKFQGAYVYKFNLDGYELKGRITHRADSINDTEEWLWRGYYSSADISRSLYIGNVLYTISNSMVKMNGLDDLGEINSVNLE
jgi:inhibitor of cysteine peptidase